MTAGLDRGWRWSVIVVSVSLLGGCFFGPSAEERCRRPQEYQTSRNVSPIEVPANLSGPPEDATFVIPATGSEGYPDGRPCLAMPPDYFGRPVD